jgi:hypothetical protein
MGWHRWQAPCLAEKKRAGTHGKWRSCLNTKKKGWRSWQAPCLSEKKEKGAHGKGRSGLNKKKKEKGLASLASSVRLASPSLLCKRKKSRW